MKASQPSTKYRYLAQSGNMASQLAIATTCLLLGVQIMQAEGYLAAIASAIKDLTEAGTSIAGMTMPDTGYRVSMSMAVENWTPFLLYSQEVTVSTGAIDVPPHYIRPGYKAGMVARKTAITATGTYGAVSWEIDKKGRRVVIMWSAPFNFDFYKNWLAVGITRQSIGHNHDWVDQMYNRDSDSHLGFSRQEYYDSVRTVSWTDSDIGISVYAIMGTGHNAVVKVFVLETNTTDLAPPVLNKVNKLDSTHAHHALWALYSVSFVLIVAD